MNASNRLKQIIFLGFISIVLFQVIACIIAIFKYTPLNVIFYYLIVYFTMRNLFSSKRHHICAAMWSILTWYLLGDFFGIVNVAIYWVLYFIKVRNNPTPTNPNPQQQQSTQVQTTGVIKKFGRIPLLRIPMPWLKYTLDLDKGTFTRDNLFPEKPEKGERRDVAGEDDDLLLKQVFDWSFTTKLYRTIFGTTCFSFQSKKIGRAGDKMRHWHNIPTSMVEPLRAKLIEVNK